jgi:hypothetical protein
MSDPMLDTAQPQVKWDAHSNLPFGIVGGIVGMAVGAAIWALITLITDMQLGYLAIAVGFFTGFGVRLLGKGTTPIFGLAGAVLSLVGLLIGNLAVTVLIISRESGVSIGGVLSMLDMNLIGSIFKEAFSGPIDLLFYGLALFFGYRFSIRR